MADNPRNPRRERSDRPPPPDDDAAPREEKSDFKRPTFYVNVLTLIVVAVYTCFACSQVRETQTANSIAKKALTEANKPYVMFSALNPNHTMDTNGDHFRVGFTFTNWGNTPANYLRFTNCDPIVVSGGVNPELRCNASEKASDALDLGPKQPISFTGSIIKESDLEDTRADKKNIYILGYVTYSDSIDVNAFGNPEQRETRICQKIQSATLRRVQPPTEPNSSETTSSVHQTTQPPVTVAPLVGLGCGGFSCMDTACNKSR
jgi:hypothetical protein